jgi:hypothetical protein
LERSSSAETQGLGIGQERRRIAEPFRQFLDHDGERARGVVGDRRRQLQRAQPSLRSLLGDGIGIF